MEHRPLPAVTASAQRPTAGRSSRRNQFWRATYRQARPRPVHRRPSSMAAPAATASPSCRRRQLRRTETGMPVPAVERLAFVLVRGAEDKGFEPLRGLPQHAFQLCSAPSVAVRPVLARLGRSSQVLPGRRRTETNETTTETTTETCEVSAWGLRWNAAKRAASDREEGGGTFIWPTGRPTDPRAAHFGDKRSWASAPDVCDARLATPPHGRHRASLLRLARPSR